MPAFEFEDVFPNPERKESHASELTEDEAEALLERILSDPENVFLTQVPQNREVIENAESYNAALAFAESRIRARITKTLEVRRIYEGRMEHIEVNPNTVLNTLEAINDHAIDIGTGADGRVVIDTEDLIPHIKRNLNSDICYKFALRETVKRGRNSVALEAELQGAFSKAARQLEQSDIGIPTPYYEIELNATQVIAMEKLHAKSVDDILRGFGSLPEWFDVDRFCDSLRSFLEAMHEEGLYHRDMHFGNVMISQHRSWKNGEPMGYIIDFGLSARAFENMEPYKKEEAGYTFTYDDDCGRIEFLRKSLKEYQERKAVHHE